MLFSKPIALCFSALAYLTQVIAAPADAFETIVGDGDVEKRDEPPLKFNIDPDIITTTGCGRHWDANINVKFAPNLIFTSGACDSIRNFIGGNNGDKDVEVNFPCPGKSPDSFGNLDTKFLVHIDYSHPVDMNIKGEQKIPAILQVVDSKKGFWKYASVELGGIANKDKNTIKYQFIYCVSEALPLLLWSNS